MKKIAFFIVFSSFSAVLMGQNLNNIRKDSISTANTSSDDYFNKVRLTLGGGIFIPQGLLSEYFESAPTFEFNLNFPIKQNKSIDFVGQIIIPNQSQDFTYIRTIDTIQAKATMMLNLFIKLKKKLNSSKNSTLMGYVGIGVSTINTDARNPFYSGQEGENKYEFISALLLAPGIDYTMKIRNRTEITLGINYHYAPYKTEGALRQRIGHSAIIPKLLFTF